MMIESSAEYHYLDIALKSLWQPFVELVAEMDAFVPRPLADYNEQRQRMFENYRSLNPTESDESVVKFVDEQISYAASERVQFTDRFTDRFMTQYVMIVFVSHALCEAAINAILAMGLVDSNRYELFTVLEKTDIKEKWRIGPMSFFPEYKFKTGTSLFETLNHLTKRRNALVHSKIHIRVDGKTLLQGSKFERIAFNEGICWMRRFFSLSYDLCEQARNQIRGYSFLQVLLNESAPIARAEAHKA